MKHHAIANNIRCIAIPKIACGLDKMDWKEVSKIVLDVFRFSGITIYVYVPGWELNSMPALEVFDRESGSEIFEQIGSDIVQACNSECKLATDFSADAKNLCRSLVRDEFPRYRNKEQSDQLIKFIVTETFKSDEHYTSNQQKIDSTIQFISEFDFTQSDLSEDEFVDLLQIIIQDIDVYSHHKYDIGKTKHKFHIPLKKMPHSKSNDQAKYPSIYETNSTS